MSALMDDVKQRRINAIRAGHLLEHETFVNVMRSIGCIHSQPRKDSMNLLHVQARPGFGKTTLLKRFLAEQGVGIDQRNVMVPEDGRCRIVYVDLAGMTDVQEIGRKIFYACTGMALTTTKKKPLQVAINLLGALETRTLLLDEFAELRRAPVGVQLSYCSQIKLISNELKMGIIATGPHPLDSVLLADASLKERFEDIRIAPWAEGRPLINFVVSYATSLQMERGIDVQNPHFIRLLLQKSEGSTKRIVRLLSDAALHAISGRHERLDITMLNAAIDNPFPEGCDV